MALALRRFFRETRDKKETLFYERRGKEGNRGEILPLEIKGGMKTEMSRFRRCQEEERKWEGQGDWRGEQGGGNSVGIKSRNI